VCFSGCECPVRRQVQTPPPCVALPTFKPALFSPMHPAFSQPLKMPHPRPSESLSCSMPPSRPPPNSSSKVDLQNAPREEIPFAHEAITSPGQPGSDSVTNVTIACEVRDEGLGTHAAIPEARNCPSPSYVLPLQILEGARALRCVVRQSTNLKYANPPASGWMNRAKKIGDDLQNLTPTAQNQILHPRPLKFKTLTG